MRISRLGVVATLASVGFVAGGVAPAVQVTHNDTVVFHSGGFEYDIPGSPPNAPSVGHWNVLPTAGTTPDGDIVLVKDDAVPGPSAGARYCHIFRAGSLDARADGEFSGGAVSSGMLRAQWRAQIRAADDRMYNALVVLTDAGVTGWEGVAIDGAGYVLVWNGSSWRRTDLPYQRDKWQEWQIEWTPGNSTARISVDGVSRDVAANPSPPAIDRLMFLPIEGGGFYIDGETASPPSTSTAWRNDELSLYVVRKLNECYTHLPLSQEYEGMLTEPPFALDWSIGPNVPTPWKGGVAGVFGDDIALVGGLWMPSRDNLAYAYNVKTRSYRAIPPPPYATEYTQGTYDGEHLYLVSGRAAGRRVTQLTRATDGEWEYTELPSLPDSDAQGRWVAAVSVIKGKWLFLVAGHPTGTSSETAGLPALPDWRLRLDQPGAQWEPMASYPPGKRNLVMTATARGQLYAFGGSDANATTRSIFLELVPYGIVAPYNGVPNYRDAHRYDPATDTWTPIRPLPMPLVAGSAIVLYNRYIVLMSSEDVVTYRIGGDEKASWTGYGDQVLCYDLDEDNYVRLGIYPYGVGTSPWVQVGQQLYSLGGEPRHGVNSNTENVLQIGTIRELPTASVGDFDGDGETDQDDWTWFVACLTGPGVEFLDPFCLPVDLDRDSDIDQVDFGLFQAHYSEVWSPLMAVSAQ